MRVHSKIVAAVITTLCLGNCSLGDDKADAEIDIKNKSSVRVLELGNEPRKKVFYRSRPGKNAKLYVRHNVSVELSDIPDDLPLSKFEPQKFAINLKVKEVLPGGEILFEVSESRAQPLSAKVENPFGLKTRQVYMSKRGFLFVRDDAKNSKDEIARIDVYSDLFAPLPDEPVGVGAQWEVTQPIFLDKESKLKASMTVVYTIKRIDTSMLDLTFDFSVDFTETNTRGANIGLTSLKGKGTGTSYIDLDRVTVDLDRSFQLDGFVPYRDEKTPIMVITREQVSEEPRDDKLELPTRVDPKSTSSGGSKDKAKKKKKPNRD